MHRLIPLFARGRSKILLSRKWYLHLGRKIVVLFITFRGVLNQMLFLKSRKIASTGMLTSPETKISWAKSAKWVSHDLLILNPCWVLTGKFFASRCFITDCELTTMCSRTLHEMDVKDIGLQLDGCSLSPLLNIGVTLAIFQSLGTSCCLMD